MLDLGGSHLLTVDRALWNVCMTHPSPADTGTAVGKVYGYALYPTAAPSSKFTITGSVALGEFGHGIAAAGSFVVIAAPDAQGKTISRFAAGLAWPLARSTTP